MKRIKFLSDPGEIMDMLATRELMSVTEAAYAKMSDDDRANFDYAWTVIQDSRWMLELAWRLLEFAPDELRAFAELVQQDGYLMRVIDEARYGGAG